MKLACITLDTEPDLNSDKCDIELFRDKDKLSAFKEVVDKHKIKINGFLATKILQCNPSLIDNAISFLPIKFELHSHNHNQYDSDSEKEIDESMEWYLKYFGKSAKGYRAPNGLISKEGLISLAKRGFVYDASIFPAYRFDEYGYNNMHLPLEPYIYTTPYKDLIELPFAAVPRIRLILCLSYVKLLGLNAFKGVIRFFGLPDVLLINSHPYDYFIKNHLHKCTGWKKWAHSRNADNALNLFDGLLNTLEQMGYNFVYIDELLKSLDAENMIRINL
jgi:hypothetical protein